MIVLKATQDKVLAVLQSVSGIVERRHTLPILSNVLLENSGGQTNILATDLEIQINTAGPQSSADNFRITTNASYDLLRSSKRRRTTSIDDLVEDDEHSDILEDDQETPEEYVQRLDLSQVILAALATLPEDQRNVVILSDIQGMNYAEIAETTMVSLGTVKSRLSRARAKMRDYLLAHKELLPDALRLYGDQQPE